MAPKKSKQRRAEEAGQLNLFDRIDSYVSSREKIIEQCAAPSKPCGYENEEEECIEIAAAVKRAIRESGMSREQVCDAINKYWGRSESGYQQGKCKKPLSYEMFNHYLSKPVEYPIKAYFLFAIHRVTQSMEPARTIVAAEGAEVATREEISLMALGKLEKNITEMQELKRQLKKKGV